MKRSVSTIADQRVNGLWEEEKSPERFYRPRHKSYKAAGLCCFCHYHSVFCISWLASVILRLFYCYRVKMSSQPASDMLRCLEGGGAQNNV